MDFFNDLIERSDEDRASCLSMLASPLVHVAVCDGVDFEESTWIRPFRETLQISIDLVGSQITHDEYRLSRIRDLGRWLNKQSPEDKTAVLNTLKMICFDVATASADASGTHVTPAEHVALREIGEILDW